MKTCADIKRLRAKIIRPKVRSIPLFAFRFESVRWTLTSASGDSLGIRFCKYRGHVSAFVLEPFLFHNSSEIYLRKDFAKHRPRFLSRCGVARFSGVPKYALSKVKASAHSLRLCMVKEKLGPG